MGDPRRRRPYRDRDREKIDAQPTAASVELIDFHHSRRDLLSRPGPASADLRSLASRGAEATASQVRGRQRPAALLAICKGRARPFRWARAALRRLLGARTRVQPAVEPGERASVVESSGSLLAVIVGALSGSEVDVGLLAGEGSDQLRRRGADLITLGAAHPRRASNHRSPVPERELVQRVDIAQRIVNTMHEHSASQRPARHRLCSQTLEDPSQNEAHAPASDDARVGEWSGQPVQECRV